MSSEKDKVCLEAGDKYIGVGIEKGYQVKMITYVSERDVKGMFRKIGGIL